MAELTSYSNSAFKNDSSVIELSNISYNPNDENVEPIANNISLAWRNLRYTASNLLGKNKVILNRLNGHLQYHSLNGFLGPSGAGKTTLLNCLNGTLKSGLSNDTEIYFNKNEQDIPTIRFIEQHVHETIIGKMTVRHVLYYAFRFKNGFRHSSEMDRHIAMVLEELLLEQSILDTPFQNCSGGEQKRIAVAQELMTLTKPTFLFVDEPTTGLDSHAAELMMKCLRRLVQNNSMTILASIHTPNSEILKLMDKVYILAKGGICIYSGPPSKLRSHYQLLLDKEIEEDKPAIEEYIRISCLGIKNETVQKMAQYNIAKFEKEVPLFLNDMKFLPKGVPQVRKIFSVWDFLLQLYRMIHIVFILQKNIFFNQLLLYTVLYIFFASLFDQNMIKAKICFPINSTWRALNQTCQEKLDHEDYVRQFQIYLLYTSYLSGLSVFALSAILFMPILKVFRNEHRNRWYSAGTFYYTFVLVRFIEMSLLSLWMGAVAYYAPNTQYADNGTLNWTRVGTFIFFIWIWNVYLQAYGNLFSLLFLNNAEYAVLSCQIVYIGIMFCTNYPYNITKLNRKIIEIAANLMGSNVNPKGLVYTFFVMDRCKEDEYSYVIKDFDINVDTVYSDTYILLYNIILFRVTSIFLLLIRFGVSLSFKTFRKSNDTQSKPIDYNLDSNVVKDFDVDENKINRIKEEKELEFEAFSRNKIIVAWRNVTLFASRSIYEIRSVKDVDPNSKLILKDLNGQFHFGTLNALMGTSGAGKTSLLKVLNGQSKTRLSEESQFYLSKFTPIRSCYLTQEVSGHLMQGLTAKQSLLYASKLKNVNETSNIDHEHIAMRILNELDLTDCQDTYVESCSGGQRKRLALGLELTALRMPNLICIDEPTSGLDSNSAEVVVDCLRRVTRAHNITIIASIHQPSTEILMLFDQVYALARGGVCIYSGPPLEIRQNLNQVLDDLNDQKVFPVECLIKHSCLSYGNPLVEKMTQISRESVLKDDGRLSKETTILLDGIPISRNRFSMKSVYMLFMRYLYYIKGYQWKTIAFMWYIYVAHAVTIIYIFDKKLAYRTGCLNIEDDFNEFCQKTDEREEEKFELHLLTFRTLSCWIMIQFLAIMLSTIDFNREVKYFWNEHRNGWYSTGAFYLMKTLVEIIQLLPKIVFYIYMLDIFEETRPGIYKSLFVLLFIGTYAIQACGHLLALLTRGEFASMIISINGAIVLYQLLGSVGTPYKDFHYIYKMLSNFSPMRFVFEGALLLLFGFDRCRDRIEIQQTLYHLKMCNDEHFYFCVIMLVFNLIFYRIVSLLLLISKSNPIENRRVRASKILEYHRRLKPSNAYIPGMSCHHEFTIKTIEVQQNSVNQ